jgi:uncharacterized protein YegL
MPKPNSLAIHPTDDLLTSPTTRLPVVVTLDTSASMHGEPLRELQEAMRLFLAEVAADPDASASADIALITAGGEVAVHRSFGLASSGGAAPLRARGDTPLGRAVGAAIDLLDQRKAQYKAAGTPYLQPWLVILTDGKPTDEFQSVGARTARLVADKKLTVFPVGVGPEADLGTLKLLAGGITPLRLKGLAFAELFKWLSASVACASRSTPGQGVALPSPFTWVEL